MSSYRIRSTSLLNKLGICLRTNTTKHVRIIVTLPKGPFLLSSRDFKPMVRAFSFLIKRPLAVTYCGFRRETSDMRGNKPMPPCVYWDSDG